MERKMITTTLSEIRSHEPRDDRFAKLQNHFGVSPAEAKTHDVPFPLALLLETNDIWDALWVFNKVAPQRVKDDFMIRRLDTGEHSAIKLLRRNPVDADWWRDCEKAILDVVALLRRRMAGEAVEFEMAAAKVTARATWSAAFDVFYAANAVVPADPSVGYAVCAAVHAADGIGNSAAVAVTYAAPVGIRDEARAATRDDIIAALNAA
jgi:hypothetical protein